MVKTTMTVTLDIDAYIEARKRGLNLSQLLSDYLIEYLQIAQKKEKTGLTLDDEERRLKIEQIATAKRLEAINKKKKALVKKENEGVKKWLD